MPKYYVAGIPFDSENALMHYGVKGMKWDKHIFGPDANTKYINWMDVGKMASSKRPSQFTDTGSDRSASQGGALRNSSQQKGPGLVRSALDKGAQLRYKANQAANQAGKAIGSAAGQALKAGSNFLTGNQAQKDLSNAQRSYRYNKKQLVNNARLYNQGKTNLANATALGNSAADRALDHDPNDKNWELPEDVRNDFDRAAQMKQTGNEQIETSQNRKNDVMNSFLNAQTRIGNAQKSVDSTLPSIANRASEGAKGFINSAGKWVSNAVGDVGKAGANAWNGIKGAANDVANFVTGNQARQNLENAMSAPHLGDLYLTKDAEKIFDAQDEYNRTLPGMVDQAGNWISGAVNDVGKAATNVWNGIPGAANDIANFVTGNQSRQNLERWQNSFNPLGLNNGRIAEAQAEYDRTLPGLISGAANDVGNWAGQAVNDVSNFVTGNQARRDLNNVQNSWNPFGVNNGRIAEAQAEYNRTLPGMVDQAGNWISGAANDAGKWIGGAANDVGKAATNAWNGVTGAAGDAGKWISGAANDVGKAASDAAGWVGDRAGDVGRTAASAWNGVSGAANDVANFVTGNQARQNLEKEQNALNLFGLNNKNIANAQAEYNRTLPGMVDQAGNWISGAANDVGRFVGNAAGDVGKAATNVWNGVTGAANSVGDWAGNAARDVGNAAGSTMKALENAYGDASKWVVDNAGTVRDAVTGAALGTADWAVQQYKNLFHSALDDKPDGVTDTFWKNYVASGGTREQYERDWR